MFTPQPDFKTTDLYDRLNGNSIKVLDQVEWWRCYAHIAENTTSPTETLEAVSVPDGITAPAQPVSEFLAASREIVASIPF